MRKKILKAVAFLMAILFLVGVLWLLNKVPLLAQKDLIRAYKDIEEVKAELLIRKIFTPSYIPQNLKWPPSTILAQGKPFPALIMEFEPVDGKGKGPVLVISQSTAEDFRSDVKIKILDVTEKATYSLKGRDSLLEVGFCGKGDPCSKISWKEEEYRINVLSKASPFELIKVAESMLQ